MFGKGEDGQDIVSIEARTQARKMAPLRTVEAYWHALCHDGDVPPRSAVDPRGMENALENAFLLERIAPSMAKIRVAGAHLSDLMGMEVSGMPLSTLLAAEDRDRFGEAVKRLFADPAIVRMTVSAKDGFGRPSLSGHLILMPLRSDFGEVSRALGALVTEGRIGRAPRRFLIESVDIEDARGRMIAGPSVQDTPPARIVVRDIPSAPLPQDPPPAERGHLRLVVSND